MSLLFSDDVVSSHVSGLAGLVVADLEPDLALGDDFQLIAGLQGADGLGGLGGLHTEADALGTLLVHGLGDHGVALHALEVIFAFGDLVLAGLGFPDELGHHEAGLAILHHDLGPFSANVQDVSLGAGSQTAEDLAVRSFTHVQVLSVGGC